MPKCDKKVQILLKSIDLHVVTVEARIGLAIFPLKKMSFVDQGSKIVLTHSLHTDPHHTHTHSLSLPTQASSRCIIKSFKVELNVFITRKERVQ